MYMQCLANPQQNSKMPIGCNHLSMIIHKLVMILAEGIINLMACLHSSFEAVSLLNQSIATFFDVRPGVTSVSVTLFFLPPVTAILTML